MTKIRFPANTRLVKLFLYVQNLQRVEIFHTRGARLGYMLMCVQLDCCFRSDKVSIHL